MIFCIRLLAQISPGDLSKPHAELEGISNCTKCHEVGNKVTRAKCLECHTEIKKNIVAGKGYHASSDVKGKNCASCHSDHHGRNFDMIKFDKKTFNHAKTGFALKGVHARQECEACHKADRIKDPEIKKRKGTYLGLNKTCLSCHDDYHQGKMSANCAECHNFESFKKSPKPFDHNKTKFPLLGKHKTVACKECHKPEIKNGKNVQGFSNLKFDNCNACHTDVHKNRFGQDCKKCHTELSFHQIKNLNTFDHDKTDFKLVGKHKLVDCKKCHTGKMTAPLKHARCTDCHKDEHHGQFTEKGITPDCNTCHSNYGFKPSEFTVERHNKTKFKLDGAHLATSCSECHNKDGRDWKFRKIGERCVDCHTDVHKGYIPEKFYPNQECTVCHNTSSWGKVQFDHDKTGFKLQGVHASTNCIECHYRKNDKGERIQKFKGMTKECSQCHTDSHVGQFEKEGKTDCLRCHGFDDWKESKFDHDTSRFKLEGAHKNVKCEECHKEVVNRKGKYIEYIFDDISCAKCHKN